ncbi:diaminopimelate epimerase [Paeniglutamicibacter antarcticus]|uniref:Diaminopimelate epimerase n=1 Tax=Paeniglutamicibacter antarcticus TaxID=494023 RepID=A0ABP9TRH0_9MICC
MSTTDHTMEPTDLQSAVGRLNYAKGHGTGNDFILVSDPENQHDLGQRQVAALCDRHRGIGGDGLIRAVPSDTLPEGRKILEIRPDAYWFMDYRNADGTISEMCGNGVRVFVHFLLKEQLVDLPVGGQLPVGTRAGLKVVTRLEDGYAVDMGPWEFVHAQAAQENGLDSIVSTAKLDKARGALSVSVGNPHTVVAVATAAELDNLDLSTAPEVEPTTRNGTNVEYVLVEGAVLDEDRAVLRMRVHERGVGETLSCGTGACAAVIATRHWAQGNAAGQWTVQVPGGELRVGFAIAESGQEHVILSGPAVLVSRGEVLGS